MFNSSHKRLPKISLVVDSTSTLGVDKYELTLGINYARRPVLERFEAENPLVYGGVISPMAALTYGFNTVCNSP